MLVTHFPTFVSPNIPLGYVNINLVSTTTTKGHFGAHMAVSFHPGHFSAIADSQHIISQC